MVLLVIKASTPSALLKQRGEDASIWYPCGVRAHRVSLAYALLCAAVVFGWQGVTVARNHGGNWTALFYTGEYGRTPPSLAAEGIYRVPASAGYDGQYYHYIAHDPVLSSGMAEYVDNPRLRWRRILVPALSWLVAAGRSEWVDPAFFAVVLAFVFLGAYWLSRYCRSYGRNPAWGVAFALVPAVVVSIDRMTIDVALAALCVGFALYAEAEPSWKLYPVLVLAPFARETGLLLVFAWCMWLIVRKDWKRAAVFSTALVSYAGWLAFLALRTGWDQTSWSSWVPLSGLLARTFHPLQYAVTGRWLAVAAATDYLAVLGIWAAAGFAVTLLARRAGKVSPVEMTAVVFAAFLAFLAKPDIWAETYAFGRTLSPLLVMLAMSGIARRAWWQFVPMGMVLPRIALQMLTQTLMAVKSS